MRKIIAVLLCLVLLCSCAPEETSEAIKITVMTEDRDFNWSEIKVDGVEISVTVVQKGTIASAVLKAEEKPNIVYLQSERDAKRLSNVLLDLSRVNVSQYERAKLVTNRAEDELQHITNDGEIYVLPEFSDDYGAKNYAWLYRADIFEKAGIEIPQTMQELQSACARLKALYPQSTPLVLRGGYRGLDMITPAWSADASIGVYYNFDEQRWKIGSAEAWAGNFVSFWATMCKANFVPNNYLSIQDRDVDALIAENRAFIAPDYVSRIEEYAEKYPDQDWRIMPPPRAMTETGQNKVAKAETAFSGYAICNVSSRSNTVAVSVLNEIYSDVCEREGKSFDEKRKNERIAQIYSEENVNPVRYLDVTDYDTAQKNSAFTLKRFLLGAIPMSQWQAFSNEVANEMGTKRILSEYKRAYNTVKKSAGS